MRTSHLFEKRRSSFRLLSESDTIQARTLINHDVHKEGLDLGKQRTEKSAESTTKIKQTEKRDAKGEKGR